MYLRYSKHENMRRKNFISIQAVINVRTQGIVFFMNLLEKGIKISKRLKVALIK